MILKEPLQILPDFRGIDMSHDNKRQIIGHVAAFVVFPHLLLPELVVDIDQSNHGKTIRVLLKSSRK